MRTVRLRIASRYEETGKNLQRILDRVLPPCIHFTSRTQPEASTMEGRASADRFFLSVHVVTRLILRQELCLEVMRCQRFERTDEWENQS